MKLFFKDKSEKFKKREFEILAKSVFNKLGVNDKIELGLTLVDDIEIRKLNSKFRGIDKPTDVLSFPVDLPRKKNDSKTMMLGDIVISLDKAKDYSQKDKKSIEEEIKILFKHGLLHLLGFDHETDNTSWKRAEKSINEL